MSTRWLGHLPSKGAALVIINVIEKEVHELHQIVRFAKDGDLDSALEAADYLDDIRNQLREHAQ